MPQFSDKLIAVFHVILTTILGFLISPLLFMLGIYKIPMVGILLNVIVSVIAVIISTKIIKLYFTYTDKITVVTIATMISAVLSIILTLPVLTTGITLITILNVVIGIAVFYFVSLQNL